MPYLRFSRDKRGYENTFVVHGERRKGRGVRVLYWFRTPPGVKVGRSALDEEAIKLIEELNPTVQFDWTRILRGDTREEPRRPEQRRREQPRRPVTTAFAGAPPSMRADPPAPESPAPRMEPIEPGAGHAAFEIDSVPAGEEDEVPPTAAHARLGAEGVLRLRARYAELRARLHERIADPAQLDQLNERAERLNPDTWVTADEVTAGLEQYEETFEALRSALGPRRRRRRGGAPDAAPEPEDGEVTTAADQRGREEETGGDPGDGEPPV